MTSRTVEIRRRKNMTRLPDDVYEEAKRRIGATLTESGDIRTGLSIAEEKKYMPEILGIADNTVTFHKEVKNFFKTLTIDVPRAGVKLEIGTDDNGNPLNVMDYVRYRFAISHPDVAREEEGVMTSRTYKFYVFDKAQQLEKEYAQTRERKEALKEYIKLTGDPKRMNMALRVLGYNPEKLDEKEKEITLEKEATKNQIEFLKVVRDKNLEMVSFIRECISKGVLRKEGNTVFNADEVIGATMEEAVAFLQDKRNSDVVVTLNARLKVAI